MAGKGSVEEGCFVCCGILLDGVYRSVTVSGKDAAVVRVYIYSLKSVNFDHTLFIFYNLISFCLCVSFS